MTLAIISIIVALVLFALATFNVPSRPNLIAAGLFFVTLAALLGRIVLLFGAVLMFAGCETTTVSDGKRTTTTRKIDTATAAEVAEEAAPLIERLWKLFEKQPKEEPEGK